VSFWIPTLIHGVKAQGSKLLLCLLTTYFLTADLARAVCIVLLCSSCSTCFTFKVLVEGNIASGKTQFLNYFKDIEGVQVTDDCLHINLWYYIRKCSMLNLPLAYFCIWFLITHCHQLLEHRAVCINCFSEA